MHCYKISAAKTLRLKTKKLKKAEIVQIVKHQKLQKKL